MRDSCCLVWRRPGSYAVNSTERRHSRLFNEVRIVIRLLPHQWNQFHQLPLPAVTRRYFHDQRGTQSHNEDLQRRLQQSTLPGMARAFVTPAADRNAYSHSSEGNLRHLHGGLGAHPLRTSLRNWALLAGSQTRASTTSCCLSASRLAQTSGGSSSALYDKYACRTCGKSEHLKCCTTCKS